MTWTNHYKVFTRENEVPAFHAERQCAKVGGILAPLTEAGYGISLARKLNDDSSDLLYVGLQVAKIGRHIVPILTDGQIMRNWRKIIMHYVR